MHNNYYKFCRQNANENIEKFLTDLKKKGHQKNYFLKILKNNLFNFENINFDYYTDKLVKDINT